MTLHRLALAGRDHLSPFPDTDYSEPEGYETVRYPLSGLVVSLKSSGASRRIEQQGRQRGQFEVARSGM
jgi:hypothetical protein